MKALNVVRRVTLLAGLMLTFQILVAQVEGVEGRSAELDKLIEAAKDEGGTLIALGTGFDTPQAQREVEAAMEKMFGIDKVTFENADIGNQNRFATRLIKEVQAGVTPSTDVYRGGQSQIPRLLAAKMLVNVDWQQLLPRIPADVVAPGRGSLAELTRMPALEYNTKLVARDLVPNKIEDLLEPRWKGVIASTPYAAGWDRAVIGANGRYDPERHERVKKVLQGMVSKGNLVGLIGCGEGNRIASGEFAMLALQCSDSSTRQLRDKGAPVGNAYLDGATTLNYSWNSVLKNAQYPNMAKLFLVFLQTEAGQKLVYKYMSADLHVYPGNFMYKEVQELHNKGVNPPLIDVQTAIDNKKAFTTVKSEFQKILRGG